MHWMTYDHSWYGFGDGYGWGPAFLGPWVPLVAGGITIVLLWSLFWKAWALWLAARRGEKVWFGVLLIINTVGILEIIYIFFVAKKSDLPAGHAGNAHHGEHKE